MSISIHALREEGDGRGSGSVQKKTNFYPRPPRGGRPSETLSPVAMHSYFYPRPPRGGRRGRQQALKLTSYFYPRPPRGGRRTHPASSGRAGDFYPRPPRGGRRVQHFLHGGERNFYPRPPRGGRLKRQIRAIVRSHFYPRPPRGGRPSLAHLLIKPVRFLSTPSARRATRNPGFMWRTSGISIHALREEGDPPIPTQ